MSSCIFYRPKTWLCKVPTVSVVQASVLSFKLVIALFCKRPRHVVDFSSSTYPLNLSGVIAKLSSAEQSRMTTLQRELIRFVAIIAGFAIAVAVLIVILWAAWYDELIFHLIQRIIYCRLRRSFPGTINVPTLLVDVVSVMGLSYSFFRPSVFTQFLFKQLPSFRKDFPLRSPFPLPR